ncbi:MAG: prepilin-type N-terminal cleavage/methylation domain-containing protein [Candidatus Thiodiazotropha sp. (ex Codakia orbicularis)]|nr:prepilin-type N-terminal cleavage/methylation domain-containing protein [Candidatus Thiodiazotropha sp. (ex Codakia orbicularis)]
MLRHTSGFTLIELMIVVAIIGILAAIVIPQYRDYASRTKWANNVSAVHGVQVAIGECINEKQDTTYPDCQTAKSLEQAGYLPEGFDIANTKTTYMDKTPDVTKTEITLSGTSEVGDCDVTMTPNPTNEALIWTIKSSGTDCGRSNTGFTN